VNDMLVHEFVQLVEVEKRNHGVAVVLGVIVGVPEKTADDDIGPHTAGIAKAIGNLGDFTIGVFKVTEKVDHGVPDKDGNDPIKEDGRQTLTGLTDGHCNREVERQLHPSRALQLLHNAGFFRVGPIVEAPAPARVVDGDTHSGANDTAGTSLEGGKNIKDTHEVVPTGGRQVAKCGVLEGLPRVPGSQLGVLVNVVGKGVMLLVHDALVFAKLKAKDTDKKEAPVIDGLGLEGIAMEELVLAGKGETLELKAVEKVERNKNCHLLERKLGHVQGEDIELVEAMMKRLVKRRFKPG
jgi:hypothetical protein